MVRLRRIASPLRIDSDQLVVLGRIEVEVEVRNRVDSGGLVPTGVPVHHHEPVRLGRLGRQCKVEHRRIRTCRKSLQRGFIERHPELDDVAYQAVHQHIRTGEAVPQPYRRAVFALSPPALSAARTLHCLHRPRIELPLDANRRHYSQDRNRQQNGYRISFHRSPDALSVSLAGDVLRTARR